VRFIPPHISGVRSGSALSAGAGLLYALPVLSESFRTRVCMLQDHVGDRANGQAPRHGTRKLLLTYPQVPIKFATLEQRRWKRGSYHCRFMRKDT